MFDGDFDYFIWVLVDMELKYQPKYNALVERTWFAFFVELDYENIYCEPNQLEFSSKLDSTIDSLNLVHEPNEPNLNWKLSTLIIWVGYELYIVRLVWFMNWLDYIS